VLQSRYNQDKVHLTNELEIANNDFNEISIRHKIGDISDEEYDIKSASVKWEIKNIEMKLRACNEYLDVLSSIRHYVDHEIVSELEDINESNYSLITESELTKTSKTSLKNTIKQLHELIEE
jgi:hypothetical protein